MATQAVSQKLLADATQLYQRVEQVKAELDNLSPAIQVAAFEKVQGDNTALIELQRKVQEAFATRTYSNEPDLEPIEKKLEATARVLEAIELNIGVASNFIALAVQAESIFRQKPPQNGIQISSHHARVTLLLNQSPNEGTHAAIEALRLKLLFVLEVQKKSERVPEPARREPSPVELPKIEGPATLSSLKDALESNSGDPESVIRSRQVIRQTYSQISINDKEKVFDAYNKLRNEADEQPLPRPYLTKISILDWPGSSSKKLAAVEKVLGPSS